jgi:hypothetical protein
MSVEKFQFSFYTDELESNDKIAKLFLIFKFAALAFISRILALTQISMKKKCFSKTIPRRE